jgi:hypothetical protein
VTAALRDSASSYLDRVAGQAGKVGHRARRAVLLVRPSTVHGLVHSRPSPARADADHLDDAIAWLGRAQDATPDGGVSAGFDLTTGWRASYPETTGYIVPTMLHHAEILGVDDSRRRALRMGEWLHSVQRTDGSIGRGLWSGENDTGKRAEVFNTGQVLFGFVALAERTEDPAMVDAAARAASWLSAQQNPDGSWTAHSLGGVPHTYYTRVAWALARAGSVLDEPAWKDGARRCADWTAGLQHENGWIDLMSFTPGADPLTHTVAYTIEGLLECGLVLGSERAWSAGVAACDAMARSYATPDGCRLPRRDELSATVDPQWRASARYSCPTGSAQLALCCQRVAAIDGRDDLAEFADELVRTVKAAQAAPSAPLDQRGGVPGSMPIWGRYASLRYLNWATKFAADMLLDRIAGGLPEERYG